MIFNLVAFCVLYLCFDGTSTEFILPKNPYKPISLPANTTKNVLIIGEFIVVINTLIHKRSLTSNTIRKFFRILYVLV